MHRARPDSGRRTRVTMATRRDRRLLVAGVLGEARTRRRRGGPPRGLRGSQHRRLRLLGSLFTGVVAFLGKTRDVQVLPDAVHSRGARRPTPPGPRNPVHRPGAVPCGAVRCSARAASGVGGPGVFAAGTLCFECSSVYSTPPGT